MIQRIKRKPPSKGGNYFAGPKDNLQFISSGCKTLDLALGGGWCEGRVANVIGDSSTGKTLLAIEAGANFAIKYPEPKSRIKYRETEHAFDNGYAEAIGFPLDRVDFGDPLETIEDLFEDLEEVIAKAKAPTFYIVDSLDGLSDRGEKKRDMDAGSYGMEKHKKLSRLFREFVGKIPEHLTLMIISQVRAKIGGLSFGPKTEPTGGFALKFYSSQRLMLSQLGTISKEVSGIKRPYGLKIKAKVIKNKVGLAFRESDFNILFGFGIDDARSCVEWLKQTRAVKGMAGGVTQEAIKKYLSRLNRMDDDQYAADMKKIHAALETRWYEIETDFLPTRKKYR